MRSVTRTLHPQDRIAHYEIVSALAAGGMGEVYLAKDEKLERSVALKVLPLELTRNEERVRRFVREAKSASSLNHPNIVTIYEIGADEVKSTGDARSAEPSTSVHYISMELISGETLTTKIHHEKTELRTLLGYLAQAADGLAKAHAAGIIHRDLKPGNIMVSKDGFAKVLDFGLAKLTERGAPEPDASAGATQAEEGTRLGAVVGTVGYMSPEQIQAKPLDPRSDIFSFGCILYEAATRKKPFAADSDIETMHRILNDKPAAIEELNPNVPAELRRLIRRCLAKNPDQRLQSAKDLAIELREIADEYDALSPSGTSAVTGGSGAVAIGKRPRRAWMPLAVAGGVLVAIAVVVGVWLVRRGAAPTAEAPPANLEVTPVAIGGPGVTTGQSISPDGRYLAYIRNTNGVTSIRVRQLATGSDVEVLSSGDLVGNALVFSPDGNYIYYRAPDPDRAGYSALFEIPTLGGRPRKRLFDIDSYPSFAPDGHRVCFLRGAPQRGEDQVMIADLASGRETVCFVTRNPVHTRNPNWSPDGKQIAAVQFSESDTEAVRLRIAVTGVAGGRSEPLGAMRWGSVGDLAWLPDGRTLIVAAFDLHTVTDGQLWLVSYPTGRVRRITTGVDRYENLTVGAKGDVISAMRTTTRTNLWRAEASGVPNVRQLTFRPAEGSPVTLSPAPSGSVYFSAPQEGAVHLFAVDKDGTERLIPVPNDIAFQPWVRPGVGIVYQAVTPGMKAQIWRADEDGTNARPLTPGRGEWLQAVSADGRRVLYESSGSLWIVPADGGPPVSLGRSDSQDQRFSPDGRRVFDLRFFMEKGEPVQLIVIVSSDDGRILVKAPIPPRARGFAWDGGDALTLWSNADGRRNLYRMPFDGRPMTPITHFTEGQIEACRWSRDRTRVVLTRTVGQKWSLWIVNADGSNARTITNFESGQITDAAWDVDDSGVVFNYGEVSRTPVLVRGFR